MEPNGVWPDMAAHQRKPELGSIHTGWSAGIGFDMVIEDRPAILGGGQVNEIEMREMIILIWAIFAQW